MSDDAPVATGTTLSCYLCKRTVTLDASTPDRARSIAERKGWVLVHGTKDMWICPVNHTPRIG